MTIINWHPKSLSNPFQVPPQGNMITSGHFPKYALPSTIPISSIITKCHQIAPGRHQNSQGQFSFRDHIFYRGGYTDSQMTITNQHPKSLSNPFQVPPQENMIYFGNFSKYALPSTIPNLSLFTKCYQIASGRYQNSQGQFIFWDHRFYRGGYADLQLRTTNWHPKNLSNPFQIPPQENRCLRCNFNCIFTFKSYHLQMSCRMSGVQFLSHLHLLLKDTRTLGDSSCSGIIDSIGGDTQMAN